MASSSSHSHDFPIPKQHIVSNLREKFAVATRRRMKLERSSLEVLQLTKTQYRASQLWDLDKIENLEALRQAIKLRKCSTDPLPGRVGKQVIKCNAIDVVPIKSH